jgi:ADP-ribose 1''-phosphate phosphatase
VPLTRNNGQQYPAAYKVHNDHCRATPNEVLIGTCQLIPPQENDYKRTPSGSGKHWIACLLTSVGYGKKATKTHPAMDKPDLILESTRRSLIDLREQLSKLAEENKKEVGELWSCKFNSGLFAVEWADTRRVLEAELRGLGKIVLVISPAAE